LATGERAQGYCQNGHEALCYCQSIVRPLSCAPETGMLGFFYYDSLLLLFLQIIL